MALKTSHVEVGSEGSTPCLDKDVAKDFKGSIPCTVKNVAKDYVEGGTTSLTCLDEMTKSCGRGSNTFLKCLDGMRKSCMERYVDDIEYGSQEERCTNNDVSYDIEYRSYMERCTNNVQYESEQKPPE